MTNEEKLVLLIEECGEVIQAATKCLRFGFGSDHGVGYGKNDEVLANEVGDLLGVINSLPLNKTLVGIARESKMSRAEEAKTKYGV